MLAILYTWYDKYTGTLCWPVSTRGMISTRVHCVCCASRYTWYGKYTGTLCVCDKYTGTLCVCDKYTGTLCVVQSVHVI